MKEIKRILPCRIYQMIKSEGNIEEIRVRVNKKLAIRKSTKLKPLDYEVSESDISYIFERLTDFSVHSYIEEIKKGFITVKNGHRVGLCGEFVVENEEIKNISKLTSINIRVATNEKVFNNLNLEKIVNKNTLIISPPNFGKTSLLREISKYLSKKQKNISVIDERYEIDNDTNLGENVDIIRGIPKVTGVHMMIKTMSPDYIICDEITSEKKLLKEIGYAGVKIIATMHGDDVSQIEKSLLDFFDIIIEIKIEEQKRIYNFLEV